MTNIHKCDAMGSSEAWIETEDSEWQLNMNRVALRQALYAISVHQLAGGFLHADTAPHFYALAIR